MLHCVYRLFVQKGSLFVKFSCLFAVTEVSTGSCFRGSATVPSPWEKATKNGFLTVSMWSKVRHTWRWLESSWNLQSTTPGLTLCSTGWGISRCPTSISSRRSTTIHRWTYLDLSLVSFPIPSISVALLDSLSTVGLPIAPHNPQTIACISIDTAVMRVRGCWRLPRYVNVLTYLLNVTGQGSASYNFHTVLWSGSDTQT